MYPPYPCHWIRSILYLHSNAAVYKHLFLDFLRRWGWCCIFGRFFAPQSSFCTTYLPLVIKVMWSCRRKNVFTFWTCVIMTALAIYVIPCKFMCNSQGVNAVFVQSEIVGLMWSPVSEVAWLVISPNKCTLRIPVIESDPSSISIQTLLYINIYFLTFYGDEAGVVFLAGFLRLSPVFARLTGGVAKARKVWPAWFTHV